ncbi:hypothetical protein [Bradyrhizobium sp. USDA 3256]
MTGAIDDDKIDAEADATIRVCLDLSAPKSFFLYAGAGSGKTRWKLALTFRSGT